MLAAAGLCAVAGGTLEILGQPPRDALNQGRTALARMDATLSTNGSVRAYLTMSAQLSRASIETASGAVEEAIAQFSLTSLADLPAARLLTPVQRAVRIAAAFVTGAELLLFDDPTAGLPDDVALGLGNALVSILRKRKYVVFGGGFAQRQPLWLDAEEAVIFRGGAFAAHATPRELGQTRAVSVVAVGNVQRFELALQAQSFRAETRGEGRWIIDLGAARTTHELLRLAHESDASLIELSPLHTPLHAGPKTT
jgi:ABC-type multidrug transport system ATPase subunit